MSGIGIFLARLSNDESSATKTTWFVPLDNDVDADARLPRRVVRVKDGARMVLVRPSAYTIGAVPHDEAALDDERPAHKVSVGWFYVDAYEVTRAQFEQFVNETGYVTDPERTGGEIALGHPPRITPWIRGVTSTSRRRSDAAPSLGIQRS